MMQQLEHIKETQKAFLKIVSILFGSQKLRFPLRTKFGFNKLIQSFKTYTHMHVHTQMVVS